MFRILADNPQHAAPLDNFTFVTNLFNGRPHLHDIYSLTEHAAARSVPNNLLIAHCNAANALYIFRFTSSGI